MSTGRMTPTNVARHLTLGPQCWSCRERRVRCGSEVPGCLKCAAKGLDCPGYGRTRPLRWRKPKNPREFRKGQAGEGIRPRKKSPPALEMVADHPDLI